MVSAKSSGNSNAGTTTARAERSPVVARRSRPTSDSGRATINSPNPGRSSQPTPGGSQPWSVAVVLVHEIGEVPGRVQDLEAGGVDSRLALPVGQVAKYVRRVRQPRHHGANAEQADSRTAGAIPD